MMTTAFSNFLGRSSFLLLIAFVLLTGCAGSVPQKAGMTAASDESVQIISAFLSEDASTITVYGVEQISGPLTYSALKQSDPLRILVYLPHTRLSRPITLQPETPGRILQVRLNHLPTVSHVTEVEIFLASDQPYQISAPQNHVLQIVVGASEPRPVSLSEGDHAVFASDPQSLMVPEPGPSSIISLADGEHLLNIQPQTAPDVVHIHIVADGPLRTYNAFTLLNPPRIVFDLPSLTEAYAQERNILLGSDLVNRIRHFGDGDKLRIVLDTQAELLNRYDVQTRRDGLLIRVGPKSSGTELTLTDDELFLATFPSGNTVAAARITTLDVSLNDRGETTFRIEATNYLHYDIQPQGLQKLSLRLYNAYLSDTLAFPPIVDNPVLAAVTHTETAAGDDVRFAFDLKTPAPFRVEEQDNGLTVHFTPPPPSAPVLTAALATTATTGQPTRQPPEQSSAPPLMVQTPASLASVPNASPEPAETAPRYTGAPISLDFFDSDIKNVFRIIGAVSGENIAVDPDVTGRVTLKLDRPVPWDQVLDIVLRMNQLDKIHEGNVIRIATRKTLKEEAEARRAQLETERSLAEQQIALEPLRTVYLPVNYATAETEVLPHITEIISERGRATVDTRNNQIIITETAEKIEQARELVLMLDRVTPQVMIEARIVEANTNFAREIGTQWGVARGVQPAAVMPGQVRGFPAAETVGARASGSETYGTNIAFNAPIPTPTMEAGFNFTRLAGIPILLNAKLLAKESQGEVKIISSPRVMTMDNKQAVIAQGLEWPVFKEYDQAGIAQYEYRKFELRLTVTPHVTLDNRISLNIMVTKDDLGGIADGDRRYFFTKEASTQLLVNNEETIVIGGIHKSDTRLDSQGVPFLSQIPVLGWMFKSDSRRSDDEELLIFITPKVVQLERLNDVAPGREISLSPSVRN